VVRRRGGVDPVRRQAGFNINFPGVGAGLTNATTNAAPSSRNGKSWNLDNTVNWLSGKHSVQFGATFSRIAGWTKAQTLVPALTLGVDTTNDPANAAMFTTTFFPGAANADQQRARSVRSSPAASQITSNAASRRHRQRVLGVGRTDEQQDEIGLVQVLTSANLTLNAGLRWQVAAISSNERVFDEHDGRPQVSGQRRPGRTLECNPGVFRRSRAGLRAHSARVPPSKTASRRTRRGVATERQRRLAAHDLELARDLARIWRLLQQRRVVVLRGRLRQQSRQPDKVTATSAQFPSCRRESWPVLLRHERLDLAGQPVPLTRWRRISTAA
jgi:hypothetical protein